DPAGRIWLSTTRGLSVTDPSAATGRAAPALAAIETIWADDTFITGTPLKVPPRPQRLVFSYTGLSLATPERVQFRYHLDGYDRGWSAPSSTRQAAYTNLGPGDYRFHVMSSNGDGAWNGDEAVVSLSIAPAFWQSGWFRAVLLLGACLAAWAAYRVRL